MIERAEHLACTYTITYNYIGYAFFIISVVRKITSLDKGTQPFVVCDG